MNTSNHLLTISLLILSTSLLASKAPEVSSQAPTKKPQITYTESTMRSNFGIVKFNKFVNEKTGEFIQEVTSFQERVTLPTVSYQCNNIPNTSNPPLKLVALLQAFKAMALKEELEKNNPTSQLLVNTYFKSKSWDAE